MFNRKKSEISSHSKALSNDYKNIKFITRVSSNFVIHTLRQYYLVSIAFMLLLTL